MSKKQTSTDVSLEQMVAAALNEQGYLLSGVVRDKIQNKLPGDTQTIWKYVESEYPVTATDGSQTRIDIVLRNGSTHLCLECKRPNPQYKRWIFFDRDQNVVPGTLSLEVYQLNGRKSGDHPAFGQHIIERKRGRKSCPVFTAYLEVLLKRDGNSGLKASHTEALEEAFRQVLKGHTGLMGKLINRDEVGIYQSIPIIVTTAELFEAQFNYCDVSLSEGKIDQNKLKMVGMEFCAVNYHADDSLAIKSAHVSANRNDIQSDLWAAQTRSVFVVRVEAVNQFLIWLHESLFAG